MQSGKTFSKLLVAISVTGFTIGMFMPLDESLRLTDSEHRLFGVIGFIFFFCGGIFGALLEKAFVKFGTGLRRLTDKHAAAPHGMGGWRLLRYFGWFIFPIGVGMATSSLWNGHAWFLESLMPLGVGLGMIFGVKVAKQILGENQNERRNL